MWFLTGLKFIFNIHYKESCKNAFNTLFYTITLKIQEDFNSVDDNRYRCNIIDNRLSCSICFFPHLFSKKQQGQNILRIAVWKARECDLALCKLHQLVQKCSHLQSGAGLNRTCISSSTLNYTPHHHREHP